MVSVQINDFNIFVKSEITILEACKYIGITIPRFCYHETLSISGNCRMCLVELAGIEKPVASCLTEVSTGINVYTDSSFVKKARENVVESLLLNHPLDCPICDQAGECDLQDQAKTFGNDFSRFFFNKRSVEDKDCGPLIKTIMTRCIQCTRCVRFGTEVAGIPLLGTLNRGTHTEIGGYISKFLNSEISGNIIDLCPVGALTSKPYGFKARPWELKVNETIDLTDSVGSNTYVNFKDSEIYRVIPKSNISINEHIISDKARFSYDSNNSNRIKNLYQYKEKDDTFKNINWFKIFDHIDFSKNVNTHVDTKNRSKIKTAFDLIVNDNIGYHNLVILKKLSNTGILNLLSLINNEEINNFYLSGLTDKIESINCCDSFCFIFSVNPKLECSVINARLRSKYFNGLFSLIGLNQYFSYNIPTNFVNLNIINSLQIFEGKYLNLSTLYLNAENPLLLISDSCVKSGFNSTEFFKYLKSFFETVKIIKINSSSNKEALLFLNIKNNNIIGNQNSVLALNNDDTFEFRKYFFSLRKKMFWLNTHGSAFASKVKFIIPILSEFEEERIQINLEQRPQKTSKIFSSFFDARTTTQILLAFFEKEFKKYKTNGVTRYSNFLYEIIKTPVLFNNNNINYTLLCFKNIKYLKSTNFLYKHPIKANIENFHCSTNATKNSLTMQKASQLLIKTVSNFS